jgi:hypothetical protein
MATYYYNGAKILAPFSIISNSPVYESDTVSLKRLRSSQGHQRWELSFECIANDNLADLFIDSIKDLDTADSMIMPQFKEVEDLCTLSGTATVTETAAVNASSVKIAHTGINGVLKKGSFVKFSNYPKVYTLTADLNMASSEDQDALIFPRLVKEVPANSTMNYGSDCVITYFKDITGLQGMSFADGILADMGSINLAEAL